MPTPEAKTLAEKYDRALRYAHGEPLPAGEKCPLPTSFWPKENIGLLERFEKWLLSGGVSEMVTRLYHIPMAGHVFGLTLKPYAQLNLETDLECALEYIRAKGLSAGWIKNCRQALLMFRRFMRLERGFGEENKTTPFNASLVTVGLPPWLVSELERYQRIQQRNWREARLEQNIRRFWSGYLRMWRFLVERHQVQNLADLKRQHILDYVDMQLQAKYSVSTVNNDLRCLRSFLFFLVEEDYAVPQSLLRVPNLKQADILPKYLTDEQVRKLRDQVEKNVTQADLDSRRRLALLARATFYLLWQGGLRLGEVEELRLEDLDFPGERLTVRNGKGLKDRTVYLTGSVILALQDYLAVRGEGSGDQVFLYRNAPLKQDLIRAQLKYAGERVGVKVYPHRLRHTCATQLLNAGCRITSIQRFLGHKKLNTTMIYARAHDQNVAEDYFAAMARVEQRLEIAPAPKETPKPDNEVVNVQSAAQVLFWIERLTQSELCQQERLEIAEHLKQALCHNFTSQLSPPVMAIAG
jgi:site-specific recombinase XerD